MFIIRDGFGIEYGRQSFFDTAVDDAQELADHYSKTLYIHDDTLEVDDPIKISPWSDMVKNLVGKHE